MKVQFTNHITGNHPSFEKNSEKQSVNGKIIKGLNIAKDNLKAEAAEIEGKGVKNITTKETVKLVNIAVEDNSINNKIKKIKKRKLMRFLGKILG